jgi:hypothetical protein
MGRKAHRPIFSPRKGITTPEFCPESSRYVHHGLAPWFLLNLTTGVNNLDLMKLTLTPDDHFAENIAELHEAARQRQPYTPALFEIVTDSLIEAKGLRLFKDTLIYTVDGIHEERVPIETVRRVTVHFAPRVVMCIVQPSKVNLRQKKSVILLSSYSGSEAAHRSAVAHFQEEGLRIKTFDELIQIVRASPDSDIAIEEI